MKTHLSASSMTTFLRCGQQWYYAYVLGEKSPPTLKQARGIAVHKAVEVNMEQKIDSKVDVPVEQMLDAYSDSWDEVGSDGFQVEEDEDEGEMKDKGIELTKLHHSEVSPTIQPLWVERPVQFDINGVTFSGQIDTVDEMKRVRDTKTTARAPRPEQYLMNMTGYALSVRQLTGEVETDTVLDYLIATKKPRYLPITAGGPVTDKAINQFANTVDAVAGAIDAGRFVPNGVQNGACSWCGYAAQCSYALKE